MNYFFVDYENVKNQGLEGIENLAEDDVVIIFYSDNVNSITFDTHHKLNSSKAEIIFERVLTGQNALDFQLAAYMGYVVGITEGSGAFYNLVTKDRALSVTVKFWRKKCKSAAVIEKISDIFEKRRMNVPFTPRRKDFSEIKADEQPEIEIDDAVTVSDAEGRFDAVINSENTAEKGESAEFVIVDEASEQTAAASEPENKAEDTEDTSENITEETPDENTEAETAPDIEPVIEQLIIEEPADTTEEAKPEAHDKDGLETKLEAVLTDKTEIPVIVKIIKRYKTKQGINNALMKKFPSQNNQKSAEIYKAIKPLLNDKKGK